MAVMGAWSKFGGEFLNPPTGPVFWLTGMSTWLSVALTLGAVQGLVLYGSIMRIRLCTNNLTFIDAYASHMTDETDLMTDETDLSPR